MKKATNRFAFWALIISLVVSFFSRGSYRQVSDIYPSVLEQPVQTEVSDKEIISFERDDYVYELTPLFDYEINGLVVHRFDYSWLGIYETGSLFPVDLCMIWGSNVESGVYKDKSLKFGQDYRWCWFRWQGKLDFDSNEASNSHLLIVDEELQGVAKSVTYGDQVRILGKLVNVSGKYIGDEKNPRQTVWKSSTTRTDSGAGGCEVIYVEGIEIIKSAHPIANFMFKASLIGLAAWFVVNVLAFVREIFFR